MISETPQASTNASHFNSSLSHIPSRFIKPAIFFASKQNTTKPVFHDVKTPCQSSFYKKYFGHNVTCVNRYTQLVSAAHSQKSLQKLAFDGKICKKDGFKSSHNLILLSNDIPTPKRFSRKVIKHFRGKISMTFKPSANNIARYLKNNVGHLQSLEITIHKVEQLGFNRRTFDGLKSLKSFSLKFDPKFEKQCGFYQSLNPLDFDPNSNYQQGNPLSSLFLLLQKTNLKRLKLNLAPYPLTPSTLSHLLLSIDQAKIPEWYLKAGMVSGDFIRAINATNSSQVIKKIDFLGLYAANLLLEDPSGEYYADECGSHEFSPLRLSDLPQLLSKSRKVLDITFTDEKLMETLLDLRPVLKNFTSLEGLYIKAPENVLQFEKGSDTSDFLWMKNLTQALVSMVDVNYRDDGYTSLYQHQNDAFARLMASLKEHCTTLESLNVFYQSSTYKNYHGVTARKKNSVQVPCESLTGLVSLQELEIHCDGKGITGAAQALGSLPNLTKLKLNVCDNPKSYTFDDKENIFNSLPHLKELEFIIFPDQTNHGKRDNPVHWGKFFAKNIGKLENLEVLRILDSRRTKIEMETLTGLLKGLCQLTTLKEIVIESKIAINTEALEMAADLSGGVTGCIEDRVIGLLQSKVNWIKDLNPNIRLIDIRSFKDIKLDCIFYKTH